MVNSAEELGRPASGQISKWQLVKLWWIKWKRRRSLKKRHDSREHKTVILDLVEDRVRSRLLTLAAFFIVPTVLARLLLVNLLVINDPPDSNLEPAEMHFFHRPADGFPLSDTLSTPFKVLLTNNLSYPLANKAVSVQLESFEYSKESKFCTLKDKDLDAYRYLKVCEVAIDGETSTTNSDGVATFSDFRFSRGVTGVAKLIIIASETFNRSFEVAVVKARQLQVTNLNVAPDNIALGVKFENELSPKIQVNNRYGAPLSGAGVVFFAVGDINEAGYLQKPLYRSGRPGRPDSLFPLVAFSGSTITSTNDNGEAVFSGVHLAGATSSTVTLAFWIGGEAYLWHNVTYSTRQWQAQLYGSRLEDHGNTLHSNGNNMEHLKAFFIHDSMLFRPTSAYPTHIMHGPLPTSAVAPVATQLIEPNVDTVTYSARPFFDVSDVTGLSYELNAVRAADSSPIEGVVVFARAISTKPLTLSDSDTDAKLAFKKYIQGSTSLGAADAVDPENGFKYLVNFESSPSDSTGKIQFSNLQFSEDGVPGHYYIEIISEYDEIVTTGRPISVAHVLNYINMWPNDEESSSLYDKDCLAAVDSYKASGQGRTDLWGNVECVIGELGVPFLEQGIDVYLASYGAQPLAHQEVALFPRAQPQPEVVIDPFTGLPTLVQPEPFGTFFEASSSAQEAPGSPVVSLQLAKNIDLNVQLSFSSTKTNSRGSAWVSDVRISALDILGFLDSEIIAGSSFRTVIPLQVRAGGPYGISSERSINVVLKADRFIRAAEGCFNAQRGAHSNFTGIEAGSRYCGGIFIEQPLSRRVAALKPAGATFPIAHVVNSYNVTSGGISERMLCFGWEPVESYLRSSAGRYENDPTFRWLVEENPFVNEAKRVEGTWCKLSNNFGRAEFDFLTFPYPVKYLNYFIFEHLTDPVDKQFDKCVASALGDKERMFSGCRSASYVTTIHTPVARLQTPSPIVSSALAGIAKTFQWQFVFNSGFGNSYVDGLPNLHTLIPVHYNRFEERAASAYTVSGKQFVDVTPRQVTSNFPVQVAALSNGQTQLSIIFPSPGLWAIQTEYAGIRSFVYWVFAGFTHVSSDFTCSDFNATANLILSGGSIVGDDTIREAILRSSLQVESSFNGTSECNANNPQSTALSFPKIQFTSSSLPWSSQSVVLTESQALSNQEPVMSIALGGSFPVSPNLKVLGLGGIPLSGATKIVAQVERKVGTSFVMDWAVSNAWRYAVSSEINSITGLASFNEKFGPDFAEEGEVYRLVFRLFPIPRTYSNIYFDSALLSQHAILEIRSFPFTVQGRLSVEFSSVQETRSFSSEKSTFSSVYFQNRIAPQLSLVKELNVVLSYPKIPCGLWAWSGSGDSRAATATSANCGLPYLPTGFGAWQPPQLEFNSIAATNAIFAGLLDTAANQTIEQLPLMFASSLATFSAAEEAVSSISPIAAFSGSETINNADTLDFGQSKYYTPGVTGSNVLDWINSGNATQLLQYQNLATSLVHSSRLVGVSSISSSSRRTKGNFHVDVSIPFDSSAVHVVAATVPLSAGLVAISQVSEIDNRPFALSFAKQPPATVFQERHFEVSCKAISKQGSPCVGIPVLLSIGLDSPFARPLDSAKLDRKDNITSVTDARGIATFGVSLTQGPVAYPAFFQCQSANLYSSRSNSFSIRLKGSRFTVLSSARGSTLRTTPITFDKGYPYPIEPFYSDGQQGVPVTVSLFRTIDRSSVENPVIQFSNQGGRLIITDSEDMQSIETLAIDAYNTSIPSSTLRDELTQVQIGTIQFAGLVFRPVIDTGFYRLEFCLLGNCQQQSDSFFIENSVIVTDFLLRPLFYAIVSGLALGPSIFIQNVVDTRPKFLTYGAALSCLLAVCSFLYNATAFSSSDVEVLSARKVTNEEIVLSRTMEASIIFTFIIIVKAAYDQGRHTAVQSRVFLVTKQIWNAELVGRLWTPMESIMDMREVEQQRMNQIMENAASLVVMIRHRKSKYERPLLSLRTKIAYQKAKIAMLIVHIKFYIWKIMPYKHTLFERISDNKFCQRFAVAIFVSSIFVMTASFVAGWAADQLTSRVQAMRASIVQKQSLRDQFISTNDLSFFVESEYDDSLSLNKVLFDFVQRVFGRGFEFFDNFVAALNFSQNVATLAALIVSGLVLVYSIEDFRRDSMLARRGKIEFGPRAGLRSGVNTLHSVRYIGAQTSNFALGWMIVFAVVFFITMCIRWSPLRAWLASILQTMLLASVIIIILLQFATWYLGKLALDKDKSIKNRRVFALFEFLTLTLNFLAGAAFNIARVAMGSVRMLIQTMRLSTPLVVYSDIGHAAYASMLYVSHVHTSPTISSAVYAIINELDNKYTLRTTPTTVEPTLVQSEKQQMEQARVRYKLFAAWQYIAIRFLNDEHRQYLSRHESKLKVDLSFKTYSSIFTDPEEVLSKIIDTSTFAQDERLEQASRNQRRLYMSKMRVKAVEMRKAWARRIERKSAAEEAEEKAREMQGRGEDMQIDEEDAVNDFEKELRDMERERELAEIRSYMPDHSEKGSSPDKGNASKAGKSANGGSNLAQAGAQGNFGLQEEDVSYEGIMRAKRQEWADKLSAMEESTAKPVRRLKMTASFKMAKRSLARRDVQSHVANQTGGVGSNNPARIQGRDIVGDIDKIKAQFVAEGRGIKHESMPEDEEEVEEVERMAEVGDRMDEDGGMRRAGGSRKQAKRKDATLEQA